MDDFTSTVLFYTLALIITFGVIGNVLSFIIFHYGKRCSAIASSAYFKCLAVADCFVLLVPCTELLLFLQPANIDMRPYSAFVCKLYVYSAFFWTTVSTWITVAITTDRTLTLCFPLKFRMSTTSRRIYLKVLCILAILIPLTSFHAIVVKYNDGDCNFVFDNKFSEFFQQTFIAIFIFLIPFVINGTCNVLISCLLWKRTRVNSLKGQNVTRRRGTAQNFTYRVLAITIFHMVSVLPIGVMKIMDILKSPVSVTVFTIANVLFYLNSGVNFVLYCVSGRDFRRDVKAMLRICCCKPELERGNTWNTSTRLSTIEGVRQ